MNGIGLLGVIFLLTLGMIAYMIKCYKLGKELAYKRGEKNDK